jgi:general secretion pathway protein L
VRILRFEPGKLSMAAAGWAEPQLAQFRERLRAAGLAAELAEGRITPCFAPGRPRQAP